MTFKGETACLSFSRKWCSRRLKRLSPEARWGEVRGRAGMAPCSASVRPPAVPTPPVDLPADSPQLAVPSQCACAFSPVSACLSAFLHREPS